MAVSQTAEYALRAVLFLAQSPSGFRTTQEIAQATRAPQSYLPKVLQPLARCGYVAAQRGARGGYVLDCDPRELTLGDVIRCVEPGRRAAGRVHGDDEATDPLCQLQRLLDDTVAETQHRFDAITINSLLAPIATVAAAPHKTAG